MKRTIFIGQAMSRFKRDPHDWPSLNVWLYSIGITDNIIKQNFFYSALVDYFPGSKNGSHRVPTKEEIKKERKRLKDTIVIFDPEIVVPIGRLSIAYCLGTGVQPLKNCIGGSYMVNPYGLMNRKVLTVPFPHPSGASTWRHRLENKKLLEKALGTLKTNLV